MKNQKAVQLVKSSNKIVSSKSAATPSAESGEVVKFNEAGMPQLEVWLELYTPEAIMKNQKAVQLVKSSNARDIQNWRACGSGNL